VAVELALVNQLLVKMVVQAVAVMLELPEQTAQVRLVKGVMVALEILQTLVIIKAAVVEVLALLVRLAHTT
jgi:hypothetical protein